MKEQRRKHKEQGRRTREKVEEGAKTKEQGLNKSHLYLPPSSFKPHFTFRVVSDTLVDLETA